MPKKNSHTKDVSVMPERDALGDKQVIARHATHRLIAVFYAKWLTLIHIAFAFFGFLIVLLPSLVAPWRELVESLPILAPIFESYSTLGGFSIIHFIGLIALLIIRDVLTPAELRSKMQFLTYKDILRKELYPKTKKEEVAYWTSALFGLAVSSLWLFFPFGVISYFILLEA